CVKRPLCPWWITYKGDPSMLFDPKEDKIYKTKLLGLSGKSHCMASSGNWILVVDACLNFCILNMLTPKRINLPLLNSQILGVDWEGIVKCNTQLAILWINERTGDYVVAWIFKGFDLFSCKKGDDSWWNWKSGCLIFRIAINKSGELLIIASLSLGELEWKSMFYVLKLNLESKKWERVDSIGDDEMLIFGHGVTIRAPARDVGDGIKSDSICFVDLWPGSSRSNCGIFDLATSRITWPKRFGVY
ncbi:unnamed protein product, partial [Arabidopsis halleri]